MTRNSTRSGLRFLGIADGQTSGACVVEDGNILAAINEERIVRMKQARGFPRASIAEVLRLSGTDPKDIAGVALCDLRMKFRDKVDDWPGWFEARAEGRGGINDVFFRVASRMGPIVPYLPGVRLAYYGLRSPTFFRRRRRIPDILRDEFGIVAPVRFFHHHYTHATAAYYTSGFDEALVVTMDGGGDGHCSHVYSVRNGKFKRLNAVGSYNSLGNYYAYVTALCGYKAKRHEGKITGLAALGKPEYRELFESMIACENGQLVNRGRVLFTAALERISSKLPSGWTHEAIAASIQLVAEKIAKSYVGYWQERTGHRNVAIAGGLFANVRINEEILHLPGVDNLFVHPGMGDEGLFVGGALALAHEAAAAQGKAYEPKNLPHVYLGTDIDEASSEQVLRDADLTYERCQDPEARVAQLLCEGNVVARAVGKMEYGPRALGNRSILYQAADPSVNDWLNKLLRRTEFMPFAPSSTYESADKLYLQTSGGIDTSRFMTTTFHCTPWMQTHCNGVVHVDDTARPQLVRRDDNPAYYRLLKEYEKLSGVPAFINTSFNIHEEPIVRTAEDAVRAFVDSSLDYLQLGPFIAVGRVGTADARRKWMEENDVLLTS